MSRILTICALAVWLVACSGGAGAEHKEREHLERAATYRGTGQLRAALIELKNALKYNEQNAETHLRIGEVQARLGETRESRLAFERAGRFGLSPAQTAASVASSWLAERNPQQALTVLGDLSGVDVAARRLLVGAQAHIQLDQLDQAEALLERVDIAAGGAVLALRRAEIAQRRGSNAEAMREIERALSLDEKLADAWMLKASLQFAAGDPSPAMDSYYRVVELEGRESISRRKVMAVHGIARSEVAQGMVDGAYSTYRELLGGTHGRLLADFQQGLARYREHDLDGALMTLERLQRDVPRHPPTLFLLGILSYEQGALDKSVEYLEKLNAVDPDNTLGVKLLAVLHLEQNRPRAAMRSLRAISHQDGWATDTDLQLLLVDAQQRGGAKDDALATLERLLPNLRGDWSNEARAARLYLRAGRPDKAAELLTETEARGDLHEPVSALLAAALVDAGREDEAREHLHAWRTRDGNTAAVTFAEAVLEHRAGKAEQARVTLEALVRAEPDHTTARRYLAELQMGNGEPTAAVRNQAELLRQLPHDLQVAERLAELLQSSKDNDLLQRDVQRMLEGSLDAQLALARSLAGIGDWSRVEGLAAQLRRGNPANAQALDLHVAALRGLGQRNEAKQLYLEASKSPALRTHALARLAGFALMRGELPEAIGHAETVLTEDHDNTAALDVIVSAYLRDGALDRARDYVDRLKQVRGGAARGYALEGQLWQARKDPQAAAQAWRRSWEMREDRNTLLHYARALLNIQQTETARSLLEGWLDVSPGDLMVRRVAAAVVLRQGDKAAALQHYRALLGLAPNDVPALNNIAWLYHEKGDERALEYARQAYELDAGNADVADTYGWLLVQSGQQSKGKQVLSDALDVHPENETLRQRLVALRDQ